VITISAIGAVDLMLIAELYPSLARYSHDVYHSLDHSEEFHVSVVSQSPLYEIFKNFPGRSIVDRSAKGKYGAVITDWPRWFMLILEFRCYLLQQASFLQHHIYSQQN
jgi:hypothetical protein